MKGPPNKLAIQEILYVSIKPSNLRRLVSWELVRVTVRCACKAEIVGFASDRLLLGKMFKLFWAPLPNTDANPGQ